MNRILISLNAVVHNRGSEALIRGLVAASKSTIPECSITLVSSELEFESQASIEGVDRYINRSSFSSRQSPIRVLTKAMSVIPLLKNQSLRIRYKRALRAASESDLIIIVGADNYDKSYGMLPTLHSFNSLIRKVSKSKMILYDCSLAEEHIDTDVRDDIELFDYVTVRENITLSSFEKFIDKSKLFFFPDPAFIMEPKSCSLPLGWNEGNMVGINASSLVTNPKYGSDKETVLNSYLNLIENILKNSKLSVVLIPHVMQGKDLSILQMIHQKVGEPKRVIIVDNEKLTAPELKYIVSKCRFFIGARTHATIAAYSSCVPTVVLGYSVKSIGIARDLFGTEENYVINVSNLSDEQELVKAFAWLQQNEEEIRKHLIRVIPDYRAKALKIGDFIKNVLILESNVISGKKRQVI